MTTWYPGANCFPAEGEVKRLGGGGYRLRAGGIWIQVPPTIKPLPSMDGKYHVCYTLAPDGVVSISAFFAPEAS